MTEAFAISMIVLFIHAMTWEGQIMSFVKKLVDDEKAISKPIYSCPICMTPWWGTLIYVIFFWIDWRHWFITIGTASGISVINVILLYVKDYCKSRTRESDECC